VKDQWQVLQLLVEQGVQPLEDVFSRLAPPPIPNDDRSFWASWPPHWGQAAFFSSPADISFSNRQPHFLHRNS